MKQIEYKVTGMTCGGCAGNVKRVLERNGAVKEVVIELSTGKVVVTFDEALASKEQLQEAIQRIGYTASLVQ